ncbi:MAG: hypothetical protein A2X94_08085 [Bdellovibrionales bacterium GWB1_55_8]|nr:MAG: hypothetical protein A2X94_08085 [Bdellovibrionales bacterium GWB1_55_8]
MFSPGSARSLYVHFPFCESKCHYCDFYSIGRDDLNGTREFTEKTRFEAALQMEASRMTSFLAKPLQTVFFGGGTPSLTTAESMRRALEAVLPTGSPSLEWTMEANPSSLTPGSLREYRNLGVNRLSLGIQSLDADLLLKLGRVHSRERALTALDEVFSSGFTNVSVDLLCGVPGQTRDHLDKTVSELLRFPLTHLSCYILTLAPGNRLFSQLPGDEEQLGQYLWLHERMCQDGFEHYEISNFSRPGYRAQHNLNYWRGRSYLGLGPSAHSYDAERKTRFKNASSLESYFQLIQNNGNARDFEEQLTEEQENLERWMLALRLEEGIPSDWLSTAERQAWAAELERQKLLEPHPVIPDRKRLTPKGFALSDQIIAALA